MLLMINLSLRDEDREKKSMFLQYIIKMDKVHNEYLYNQNLFYQLKEYNNL